MTAPFTAAGNKVRTAMSTAPETSTAMPSPPSGSSSDTLHESESFEDDRKYLNLSPLSTSTLNFEDLQIHDDDLSHQHKYVQRFSGPQYNDFKQHHSPAPAQVQSAQHFRRNNYHHRYDHGFTLGSGAQRNTRTWMSDEARAAQEFLVVRNSMKRQFKNSEIARWKVADYIAHREAVMAAKAKRLVQQAQGLKDEANFRVPPISPSTQDMMRRCGLQGNFEQVGNRGRALGAETIWCDDWKNGKDEIAPWPCMAELKWEGDDRAKTGVGRYPPLPREQGPPGIAWIQLQVIEQYPIDQIARIPTMEDVYLPVDEIDEEVKYDLLNKDLEDAMDACLES
jgi:hypothetical protein